MEALYCSDEVVSNCLLHGWGALLSDGDWLPLTRPATFMLKIELPGSECIMVDEGVEGATV